MLLRIDHIDLAVKDASEMAEFLGKLGFEVVRRTEHHGLAYEMRLPGDNQITVEFHQVERLEQPGLNHIAFLVDDCEASLAELKAKGIKFDSGVNQVKVTGRYTVNFRDPHGFRMQLTK